jgi:methionyl-tRNA formyltransferase
MRETTVKLWAAHTVPEHGEPGSILRADDAGVVVACGEDALCVTELQRPGSRRMAAAEFLHGFAIAAGERFK